LEAFLAVVSAGHFGRAAHALGISQPLLSMRLRNLEKSVGEQLLERRPHVSPTLAGTAFRAYAERAMDEIRSGTLAAHKAARGITGRLAVAYPSWVVTGFVPEVINAFRLKWPEVDLQLRILRSSEQVRQLREGRLDIAFLRDPESMGEFATAPLYSEPWLLAVRADDPRARNGAVDLAAFDDVQLVLPDRQALNLPEQILGIFRAAGVEPQALLENGSWLAILSMVAMGAGVALIPASQRCLWQNEIAYLPIRGLSTPTRVFVLWRSEVAERPAIAFVNMLRARAET
jgi:DNA-binding transcriptional LysR family regulator